MIRIQTILCPVDFSDASRNALRYAKEFARNMHASVYLLNIVEPRPMAVDISLNYVPVEEELEKAASDDLREILGEFSAEGIKAECGVQIGNPSDSILDAIDRLDANLVIMGSHGKKGLSRLIMGSVAETVVRKANCPVLTVKAEEREFIADE
ncbi:MAG: universal stress protein [Chlorobiaceae bacterium]|nr:universal stress protein [Chlorobiaceae bacterium]NTV60907.1 universal stress protein [Chlorobiaceae bacterium]